MKYNHTTTRRTFFYFIFEEFPALYSPTYTAGRPDRDASMDLKRPARVSRCNAVADGPSTPPLPECHPTETHKTNHLYKTGNQESEER